MEAIRALRRTAGVAASGSVATVRWLWRAADHASRVHLGLPDGPYWLESAQDDPCSYPGCARSNSLDVERHAH